MKLHSSLKNKNHIPKTWRLFEQLVAQIEAVLCPKGAIVNSPDKIPDKITGELREVDVSIRFKVGSADILIIIECRERSKKQDILWIEQLATKQRNVGASKAIAVTSKGISETALKKAKFYDIDIRKLQNIKEDTILEWLNFSYRHYRHHRYIFIVDEPDTSILKSDKPISKLEVYDEKGKKYLVDDILWAVWDMALDEEEDFIKPNLEWNTKEMRNLVSTFTGGGGYYFKTKKGMIRWRRTIFKYTLEITKINTPREKFIYSDPDDILAIGYTFDLPKHENEELFHTRHDVEKSILENPKQ